MSNWTIQCVDHMKYTKDVVTSPPSDSKIATFIADSVSLGANYVAIATPYDNPSGGDSVNLTQRWITAARTQGLKIWHRHMGLSFEGIYGVTKVKNLTAYTQQIVDYINANPDFFHDGDIFTPTPEPDSAGITGVVGGSSPNQFDSATEFNSWVQTTQTAVKAAFSNLGKTVSVGYYGFSSFIVWGENNPDWQGIGFLTQATVDACDGIIAMDTYPESHGGTMADSLNGAHTRWPSATIVVGEWGTINASDSATRVSQINTSMAAAKLSYVSGFNYWNMGPSGWESLLNSDLTTNSSFTAVQSFFVGSSPSASPSPSASLSPSSSISRSPSRSVSSSISSSISSSVSPSASPSSSFSRSPSASPSRSVSSSQSASPSPSPGAISHAAGTFHMMGI